MTPAWTIGGRLAAFTALFVFIFGFGCLSRYQLNGQSTGLTTAINNSRNVVDRCGFCSHLTCAPNSSHT